VITKVEILNSRQISQKLNRIAYQIYESNYGEKHIFIAGIDGNGYLVAKRIFDILKRISDLNISIGKITIDKINPVNNTPRIDFKTEDFKGKNIVLVDDVLNSGKTLIYALKVFLDQPVKKINTAVLVDRSHTLFPIKADFVGLSLSTTLQERINADLSAKGKEFVVLV
jgi:pyrimidine operon attenuation protein/uracil phosphoribosyltransferase